MSEIKSVLITPLDWGLGHATRCIPIIRELLVREVRVYIATSGLALKLLKAEFPELIFFELPSYDVHYSSSLPLAFKIFLQLPKFARAIRRERRAVRNIIIENRITHIISDNRYGCWSTSLPSVIITHQCRVLLPWSLRWLQPAVNYMSLRQLENFSECWIPDEPEKPLTARMSRMSGLKQRFIGTLSRFQPRKVASKFRILVMISGPEPQRTIFEQLVLAQLPTVQKPMMIVRGLPGDADEMQIDLPGVFIANHFSSSRLEEVILQSDLVVCRSGYSTIMDLMALQKKAVFIPTPGQTEQEYLAKELERRKIALCMPQEKFDLVEAIDRGKNYNGFEGWTVRNDLLSEILDKAISPMPDDTLLDRYTRPYL